MSTVRNKSAVLPVFQTPRRTMADHFSDIVCGKILHPGGVEANLENYGPAMTDTERPRSRSYNGPQLTPPYRRKRR